MFFFFFFNETLVTYEKLCYKNEIKKGSPSAHATHTHTHIYNATVAQPATWATLTREDIVFCTRFPVAPTSVAEIYLEGNLPTGMHKITPKFRLILS